LPAGMRPFFRDSSFFPPFPSCFVLLSLSSLLLKPFHPRANVQLTRLIGRYQVGLGVLAPSLKLMRLFFPFFFFPLVWPPFLSLFSFPLSARPDRSVVFQPATGISALLFARPPPLHGQPDCQYTPGGLHVSSGVVARTESKKLVSFRTSTPFPWTLPTARRAPLVGIFSSAFWPCFPALFEDIYALPASALFLSWPRSKAPGLVQGSGTPLVRPRVAARAHHMNQRRTRPTFVYSHPASAPHLCIFGFFTLSPSCVPPLFLVSTPPRHCPPPAGRQPVVFLCSWTLEISLSFTYVVLGTEGLILFLIAIFHCSGSIPN